MVPISARGVMKLCMAATLSAILYRYWLITPVLNHLSLAQWRAVAIGVAALVGSLWGLSKWNISTLACGSMVGLLAGGTWTALPISHGSIVDAFESNLESFGRDMIILTTAVALGGHYITRFSRRHRP